MTASALRTMPRNTLAGLIEETHCCAAELGITRSAWAEFLQVLEKLHDHNPAHFLHSLRVGLYVFGLGRYLGRSDLRLLLYGGCGHDFGKCDISNDVLDHRAFGPEQYEVIKEHVFRGFEALKDRYLFTAFIAGLHHLMQDNGYGIDLDAVAPFPLRAELKAAILSAAALVAMVDFFDALTTRKDGKGLLAGGRTAEEVMAEQFPGQERSLRWLFAHRISLI